MNAPNNANASTMNWNAGGWFGGAIGGSAWMLVVAGFLAVLGQPTVALIPLACFALSVAAAVALWFRSESIDPLTALLMQTGVFSFTIPTAWLATTYLASDAARAAMNWPTSPAITALVLFLAPLGGIWLLLQSQRTNG